MEVAQAGMASVIHKSTAIKNMAMTRCCTIVKPSMPNIDVGRFQTNNVINAVMANIMDFFLSKSPDKTFFNESCIVYVFMVVSMFVVGKYTIKICCHQVK